jgi:hypothetical protein
MSILDQIKAAVLRMVGRFAKNQAEHQAQGMAREAQGIVERAQELARRNPLGFALLVALGAGLLWLAVRRKQTTADIDH